MYKVALTNPIAESALERLRKHADVRLATSPTPREILAACEGSDAVIVRAQLPDQIFAQCRSLRAAVRHGTGLDFIPLEQAEAHGVTVANVPGVNAGSVAEHATLLMLGLARRGFDVTQRFKREGWNLARNLAGGASEVQGCTLGIVGFGNVGRRLGGMWQAAFGSRILAYSPNGTNLPGWAESSSLSDLAVRADFVVLCCPLNEDTRGLVDAKFLASMQPHAFLINVARGGVVDESALVDALRQGKIAGAGLDVYAEHPLSPASALLQMDNVICTPHCAGISATSLEAMGRGAVDEVLRILDGHAPLNPVKPLPAAMRIESGA